MRMNWTANWMAAWAALVVLMLVPAHEGVAADKSAGATAVITNQHVKTDSKFGAPDKVYTRDEIRAARPLGWAPAPPPDLRYEADKTFREASPEVGGPPSLGRPGAPNLKADHEAKRDFAEDWSALKQPDELSDSDLGSSGASADGFLQGENDVDFGTSDIYTGYRGNFWASQQLKFPWKAVGKLLIDGGGYCTAQSITGAPKNILVTAAHCVYDRANGTFYSGWTFVPAERNGVAPYGQFRWASARVLKAYIKKGTRRTDVALIRLQNNAQGQPVSFYTGWLGWRVNFPYTASLHSIGYASNISTEWTSMCAAESFSASCEGADVLVKGCNMTFGSSGGAWIEQYRPYEVSGYVEAVVSGPSCAGTFGQTYVGPRFSTANFATLCAAEGGCTTP